MSDVFISYSRRNTEFARRLIDRLILKGKDAWVDWEGIPLSSPNWWAEIKSGIEGADNFVYIMSPDSMASVVCNMELDYAIDLGKRVVPVMYQEVASREAFATIADFEPDDAMEERLSGKDPLGIARENWQRLSHINWVFFRDDDNFDDAFEALVTTVETDLEYVKGHTRYLTRATEWQREHQRADLLLFGEEIDRAEEWLQQAEAYAAKQSAEQQQEIVNPLAQPIQREYISISRQAERRRRRLARSAQVSIGVLALVLVGGLIVGSSIVRSTQQQVDNVQATSDQNIIVANTQVAGIQATSDRNVSDANATLTPIPPTLTQAANEVVTQAVAAQTAAAEVMEANATATQIPPTLTQAAVVRAELERDFDLNNAFSNVLLNSDNPSVDIMGELDSLIETYSDTPYAYLLRGIARNAIGEYEAAVADYNVLLELDITYAAIAYSGRGRAQLQLGDTEQALADFNQAIEIDPELAEAYYNRGDLYLQQAFEDESNRELVVADWLRAQELGYKMPERAIAFLDGNISFLTATPTPASVPDEIVRAVQVGENRGQLAPGTGDIWTYFARAGERVTLSVEANWDTELIIVAPHSEVIGYNDDSSEMAWFLNSQIADLYLPVNGQYLLTVQSQDNQQAGPYTLTLELDETSIFISPEDVQDLIVGSSDRTLPEGDKSLWTYAGRAGETITITVEAQWDTTLLIADEEGNYLEFNDDDAALTNDANSRIQNLELLRDGNYRIIVGSFRGRYGGDYQITLETDRDE